MNVGGVGDISGEGNGTTWRGVGEVNVLNTKTLATHFKVAREAHRHSSGK